MTSTPRFDIDLFRHDGRHFIYGLRARVIGTTRFCLFQEGRHSSKLLYELAAAPPALPIFHDSTLIEDILAVAACCLPLLKKIYTTDDAFLTSF